MNQDFAAQNFHLTPDPGRAACETTLARILVPGSIIDERLAAYCRRLQDRFNLFCSTCPAPQWHKGLIITPEIRCQTEAYIPLVEIQSAFRHLFFRSFHYNPFLPAVPIFSALSWVDALARSQAPVLSFNPARIIAEVGADQTLRAKLLAALFIPKRYGGGFERYPLQKKFLQEWLPRISSPGLTVLDAACGSGEGVYELAGMLAAAGFHPDSTAVHGCTIEPLELVAAAHGWLPHDSAREQAVIRMIAEVVQRGGSGSIEFFREDICQPAENLARYDVVICNGLLGGPLLNEHNALEVAVKGLVQRVKKGGIILAADRFHAGWRRVLPLERLKFFFVKHGIRLMNLPEGIGGIRT